MKKIEITEPIVIPVKPTEKGLVAFASCVINNSLSLNSIAIYTKLNGEGYRLCYPDTILPNGARVNFFYPINREAAKIIDAAILKKYEEVLEKVRGGR